jgi:hypothetical protein
VFDAITRRWQQHKFRQTAETQALRAHTHQFFDETILRSLPKKEKYGHINNFLQNVGHIMTSQNAFLSFREQLGGSVTGYAELQVLLSEAPRKVLLWAVPVGHHRYRSLAICGAHFDVDPPAHAAS